MNRIVAGLCVTVLALAGCTHATKTIEIEHYQLSPSLAALKLSRPAFNPHGKVLHIARIAVPSWLAGTAMYYRLAYRDDNRIARYSRSDWVAPPATMLEPIVQRMIAGRGKWRAVLDPEDSAAADARLRIRIDDFSQHFARPALSDGVIDATATLVDAHDGHVIAQQHFHVAVAAASGDARGGAAALADASIEFASRLQAWLASQQHGAG